MRAWILAAVSVGAPGLLARADVVSILPSRDNTLINQAPGSPTIYADGAGAALFSGVTADNFKRRALIEFDIAGSIPAGATITRVDLTLTCTRTRGGSLALSLYRMTSDWGEGDTNPFGQGGLGAPAVAGDATWNERFFGSGNTWTTPGGDFVPVVSATRSVSGTGVYQWTTTPQLVADVQSWLNNPDANYGWILKSPENVSSNAKRFTSRQSTATDELPKLRIEYTVPTPATAAVLGLAGCVVTSRRRRTP